MSFKSITLTTLLAVVCSFSACTGNKTATTDKAAAIHLTKADNGKTVQCKVNNSFDITFNECRGCASVWEVVGLDKAKLEQSASTYSNPSCTNCTGGNQDVTFHFKAKAAGTSNLTFSYFDEKVTLTVEAK
jgi:predicted secreted protein